MENQTTEQTEMQAKQHPPKRGGIVAGWILVVLGILFLLNNFHILDFGRFWPLIFIAIGIIILLPMYLAQDVIFVNKYNKECEKLGEGYYLVADLNFVSISKDNCPEASEGFITCGKEIKKYKDNLLQQSYWDCIAIPSGENVVKFSSN